MGGNRGQSAVDKDSPAVKNPPKKHPNDVCFPAFVAFPVDVAITSDARATCRSDGCFCERQKMQNE